eukprot:12406276-Karenia_brevis.AAC.1
MPRNKTTQADAIRAYVHSDLKSVHPTWVIVPPGLQPEPWEIKSDDPKNPPMRRLVEALHGHPESGGHREKHLTRALVACGATP